MAEEKKEKAAKKPAAKKTVKAETKKAPAKKTTPKAKKEEAAEAAPAKKAAPKKETAKAKKVEVEAVVEETPKAKTEKKAVVKAEKIVADPNFDWDGFEAGIETYSAEEKAELSEAYEGTLSQIAEKEVVHGIVIAITSKEIVINIGYKSEGVVPKNEFRYNPDLKVGDAVDL